MLRIIFLSFRCDIPFHSEPAIGNILIFYSCVSRTVNIPFHSGYSEYFLIPRLPTPTSPPHVPSMPPKATARTFFLPAPPSRGPSALCAPLAVQVYVPRQIT